MNCKTLKYIHLPMTSRQLTISFTVVVIFSALTSLHLLNLIRQRSFENTCGKQSQYQNVKNTDASPHVYCPHTPRKKDRSLLCKNSQSKVERLISKLKSIALQIYTAKRHVRGTKTREALIQAQNIITDALRDVDIDWRNIVGRTIFQSRNVCPEQFMGFDYGNPFFEQGFKTIECNYSKPINELITIVLVPKILPKSKEYMNNLLKSIRQYDAKIKICMVLPKTKNSLGIAFSRNYLNLTIIYLQTHSIGRAWNKLIGKVNTKYTLVARDIAWFNTDARLDRLIREIETLNVTTAGGATRNVAGQWSIGCYQRALRNNTLTYKAGYDVSMNGCMFCDHLDGPFVIRTDDVKQIQFDISLMQHGLFEDLFLRMGKKDHILCPDSMFFIQNVPRINSVNKWKQFAKTWELKRLILSGTVLDFPCPSEYTCRIGGHLSPCCQQELSDLVNTSINICNEFNVVCEALAGTLLGAIKFNSILPWEEDADIYFLSSNYSALRSSKTKFQAAGYKFKNNNALKPFLESYIRNTTLSQSGHFDVFSKHWRLQFIAVPFLPSVTNTFAQTKLRLNGNWIRAPRNPGLVARNTYGKEIYHHALHKLRTHRRDFPEYFLPCTNVDLGSCLINYNTDGNIQFEDPIP